MNVDSMFSLMDIIVIVCGIYVTFQTFTMISTGTLQQGSSLLPKDLNVSKCKDTAGYIKCMGMKQMILGILAILSGVIGMLRTYTSFIGPEVYMAGTVILIIYLIYYAVANKKAIEKFW